MYRRGTETIKSRSKSPLMSLNAIPKVIPELREEEPMVMKVNVDHQVKKHVQTQGGFDENFRQGKNDAVIFDQSNLVDRNSSKNKIKMGIKNNLLTEDPTNSETNVLPKPQETINDNKNNNANLNLDLQQLSKNNFDLAINFKTSEGLVTDNNDMKKSHRKTNDKNTENSESQIKPKISDTREYDDIHLNSLLKTENSINNQPRGVESMACNQQNSSVNNSLTFDNNRNFKQSKISSRNSYNNTEKPNASSIDVIKNNRVDRKLINNLDIPEVMDTTSPLKANDDSDTKMMPSFNTRGNIREQTPENLKKVEQQEKPLTDHNTFNEKIKTNASSDFITNKNQQSNLEEKSQSGSKPVIEIEHYRFVQPNLTYDSGDISNVVHETNLEITKYNVKISEKDQSQTLRDSKEQTHTFGNLIDGSDQRTDDKSIRNIPKEEQKYDEHLNKSDHYQNDFSEEKLIFGFHQPWDHHQDISNEKNDQAGFNDVIKVEQNEKYDNKPDFDNVISNSPKYNPTSIESQGNKLGTKNDDKKKDRKSFHTINEAAFECSLSPRLAEETDERDLMNNAIQITPKNHIQADNMRIPINEKLLDSERPFGLQTSKRQSTKQNNFDMVKLESSRDKTLDLYNNLNKSENLQDLSVTTRNEASQRKMVLEAHSLVKDSKLNTEEDQPKIIDKDKSGIASHRNVPHSEDSRSVDPSVAIRRSSFYESQYVKTQPNDDNMDASFITNGRVCSNINDSIFANKLNDVSDNLIYYTERSIVDVSQKYSDNTVADETYTNLDMTVRSKNEVNNLIEDNQTKTGTRSALPTIPYQISQKSLKEEADQQSRSNMVIRTDYDKHSQNKSQSQQKIHVNSNSTRNLKGNISYSEKSSEEFFENHEIKNYDIDPNQAN